MDRATVLRRLEKLRIMVERCDGGEARNAKILLDRMLDKYDFDLEETESKQQFPIPYSREFKSTILHLAHALGYTLYRYGRRKLFIECTQTEYNMFDDMLEGLREVYARKKAKIALELQSYMYGFMKSTYPVEDTDPTCPECHSELVSHDRYVCPKCGWKGRKFRYRAINRDAVAEGSGHSGRLLG